MTIKTICTCGAEFYVSYAEETESHLEMATQKYNTFMKIHRNCCTDPIKSLPEDWKV